MLIQEMRFAKGLDPVADAFAGTVRSDVISVREYGKIAFLLYKGVGTTGTSTITVSAADDNSPSTEVAVPFHYRRLNNTDEPGAVTAADATGFVLTAGSSDLYAIEIDSQALAASGYRFVCLKAVESVDSPVVGAIIVVLCKPRFVDSVNDITT